MKRKEGHRSNTNHITNDIIFQHFNQPDHSIPSIQVCIIDKIYHMTINAHLTTSLCRQNRTLLDSANGNFNTIWQTMMLYIYFIVLVVARWMWWTYSTLVGQIKMAFFPACNIDLLQSKHVQNFPIKIKINANARY